MDGGGALEGEVGGGSSVVEGLKDQAGADSF